MADVASGSSNGSDGEKRSVGDHLTSTLLVLSTLCVGIVCAVVLASTLTQTRMSGITVNGVNINIWKLNEIRSKWSDVQDQIVEMTNELGAVEKQRREIASKKLQIEAAFEGRKSELQVAMFELTLRMDAAPTSGWVKPASEDPATMYWSIKAQRDAILKDRADLRPMVDNIDQAYEAYRPARAARADIRARSDSIAPEIKVFQDAIKGTRTSLDTLFEQISIKLDESTRYRVENVLYELNSGWLAQVLNPLITLQPDVLTLTLVILMGVLGASLQITYTFFKREEPERLGVYFLRVCVGAITALVIFIVAKAGVPVIADASRLGGDAPINPYFVSFLAIISGLMSERAIVSVQAQAGRFFGPDSGGEALRWARHDLHEDFNTAKRKPEDVRKLLNVEDDTLQPWISGEKPVPMEAQKMIAGVLGVPVRELFTDIPPDEAPAAAPPPRQQQDAPGDQPPKPEGSG